MPNPKIYQQYDKLKGRIVRTKGIELTEGEQLILIKENLKRARQFNILNSTFKVFKLS